MILLADLLPNKFDLMKKSNEFKDSVILFNNTINNIIEELNNMKENMSYYSKIYEFLITNYEEKERNYETLLNINELTKNNDEIITQISYLNEIKTIKDKIMKLFDIYHKTYLNEIKMTLHVNYNGINSAIYALTDNQILSENSNNELYINNKKHKFKEAFIPKKEGDCRVLIKLKNDVTNCSNLFSSFNNPGSYCSITHLDLSNFITYNITDMSYMFKECNIPNINLFLF